MWRVLQKSTRKGKKEPRAKEPLLPGVSRYLSFEFAKLSLLQGEKKKEEKKKRKNEEEKKKRSEDALRVQTPYRYTHK